MHETESENAKKAERKTHRLSAGLASELTLGMAIVKRNSERETQGFFRVRLVM